MREKKNLNHNNKTNSDARGTNPLVITVFISIILMVIVTAVSFYFYVYSRNKINAETLNSSGTEYSQYYALICENTPINQQIYEYAKAKGDTEGICVDMLSQRIRHDYSVEELFEIAMNSKVDGIIVEANDSKEMKRLIDVACSSGIDVVTFLGDSPDSLRRSSIQVSTYNLGKMYGQQVVSGGLIGSESILVINDSSNSDSTKNLLVSGIQDALNRAVGKGSMVQVVSYDIDGSDTFVMEEMIRAVFIDGDVEPDIIICPDDKATEIVYQAIVDYNRVGSVRLIGYHNSDTVLSGIKQGVIEATIAVDVKEIGENSVETLMEYKSSGFTSEYYSVGTTLIDINNISKYYSDENN